jgi:hypothetical protein
MRRLVLLLALAVPACRAEHQTHRAPLGAREHEVTDLEVKRKSAVWDLSRDSRFNPQR